MKKLFVFFLPVISFAAVAQSPTGKIVVKKGQHFVIESKSDGAVTQEMAGQSMPMTFGSATNMTADVKDSKDNNYTITQMITHVKSTFSGMGQDKNFDSDKKEDMDGEAGAAFKDILNVPKDVVISNEGKTVSSADTTKKVDDSNPLTEMMQAMGGGKDNVAALLFLVIPEGKKAGDTWKDSTITEGIKFTKSYTLNSLKDNEASVTMTGVMDINKKMQVQGMDMNMTITNKVNSVILVDIANSVQKENKSSTDITGTIEVMGQSVPMTSKVTTVTTVKML